MALQLKICSTSTNLQFLGAVLLETKTVLFI